MLKKAMSSLSTKIVIIVLVVLILSTALVGIISYALNRGDAIKLNAERALSIAQSVVANVDPEQFQQIMETNEKNDYYDSFKSFIDQVYARNNVLYLYVLDEKYDDNVYYFAEGYVDGVREDEPMLDLGAAESIEYYDPILFESLSTGKPMVTDIYDSGEFGYMVSGFVPILDNAGDVIGVACADLAVSEVIASSTQFGLMIIGIVLGLCLVMGFFFAWYVRRFIGHPIVGLTKAAERIAVGDIDVSFSSLTKDEIGKLTDSFANMTASTKEQALVLEALANGDLTADISMRSERDSMNGAIIRLIDNLNRMFREIQESTFEVSSGARQIADGAQSLAEGTTDQASTMERLSSFISDVATKTKDNAERTDKASSLSNSIKANAETGSEQMARMMSAVIEINDASTSISKVIKVIDDIAFQTNILALNAAVEAARAGQHGKGFAVVAEEVRNLAGKSADAAKDTGTLIANSMEKAELGAKIASETAESLQQIVNGINESSVIVDEIAKSSDEQSAAIEEINKGIDSVAQVVMQNSATSEESASSSQHMSAQSDKLQELVSRFKLKDHETGNRLTETKPKGLPFGKY